MVPPPPREDSIAALIEAAIEVQDFCNQRGWEYAIIGALSLLRWGEPRATQDVDLTLLTGLGDEEQYIRPLCDRFALRYIDGDRLALESRVLLLTASNGSPVDVSLAWFPWEEAAIRQASDFAFRPGQVLRTLSLNDMVVYKAASDRLQDIADTEGLIARNDPNIRWDYVVSQLRTICDLMENDEPLLRLERLRNEIQRIFELGEKFTDEP